MLDKFIKSYPGNYQYPTLVRHKGVVIAFAMKDRRIFYSLLHLGQNNPTAGPDQKPKSFLDVDGWDSSPAELIFPNEIAEVGFGAADQVMLPTFKNPKKNELESEVKPEPQGFILPPSDLRFNYFQSTTARFTEDAPFQVLSDGQYIYVFRQAIDWNDQTSMVYVDEAGHFVVKRDGRQGYTDAATKKWITTIAGRLSPLVNGTLLVDRFLMIGNNLTPKMEVRYQRSRSKTRPASRKDSLGSKDLDGNIFYEPTQELRFVCNLTEGHFSVLLLPTAIAEIQRWQIFAENGITGRIDSYNVERSSDGLFNTRGSQTYTCQVHPGVYERQMGKCRIFDKGSICDRVLIPRLVEKGYSESALEFNGNAGFVQISDVSKLDFTSAITLEVWLKTSNPSEPACFAARAEGSGQPDYSLGINADGNLSFTASVGGKKLEAVSGFTMKQDTWHHVCGTFDGKAVRIFVNGNEHGKTEGSGSIANSAANFTIAKSSPSHDNPFVGSIDEVRLWKRARSGTELKADIHQRLIGLESDLVGYWRFDENSGDTVHDQTNNKTDGTIHGLGGTNPDAKWIPSTAPVGEHPGIERTSFVIHERRTGTNNVDEFVERSFSSAPASLLYYQQSNVESGYSKEEKPLKNAARVMLAVPTTAGDSNDDKKYIAALDLGVSTSGRLALMPDVLKLDLRSPTEDESNKSINEKLDEYSMELKSKQDAVVSREKNLEKANKNYDDKKNKLEQILTTEEQPADDSTVSFYNKSDPTMSFSLFTFGPKSVDDWKFPVRVNLRQLIEKAKQNNPFINPSQMTDFKTGAVPKGLTVFQDDDLKEWIISLEKPATVKFYNKSMSILLPPLKTIGPKSLDELKQSVHVRLSDLTSDPEKKMENFKTGDIPKYLKVDRKDSEKEWIISLNPDKQAVKEFRDAEAKVATAQTRLNSANTDLKNFINNRQPLGDPSVTMPRIFTDPRGLTNSGGLLGFAWTDEAPLLFDSATGTLTLYFRGKDGQFFAAYYKTLTDRAKIKLPEVDPVLVTCIARSAAYEQIKLKVEVEEGDTSACTITISYADSINAITETWPNVPRDAVNFSRVLNGQATGHTFIGSGLAQQNSILTLSLPGARREINAGTKLMIGDRRVTVREQVFLEDTTILFDIDGEEGELDSGEILPIFQVEYDYSQPSCNGVNADLKNGSILIRAVPSSGSRRMIPSVDTELKTDPVYTWSADAPGSTVYFNGEDQYANKATNLQDANATDDLTLEAWVKPEWIDGKSSVLRHRTDISSYSLALEGLATDKESYKFVAGVNEKFIRGTENISAGEWTHLAAVYKQAYALKFDGGQGYLNCGNNASLNLNNDLTIEVSLQVDVLGERQGLLTRGTPGSISDQKNPYSMFLDPSGHLVFAFEDESGLYHSFTSSGAISPNIPQKVAVTRRQRSYTYKWEITPGIEFEFFTFQWYDVALYVNGTPTLGKYASDPVVQLAIEWVEFQDAVDQLLKTAIQEMEKSGSVEKAALDKIKEDVQTKWASLSTLNDLEEATKIKINEAIETGQKTKKQLETQLRTIKNNAPWKSILTGILKSIITTALKVLDIGSNDQTTEIGHAYWNDDLFKSFQAKPFQGIIGDVKIWNRARERSKLNKTITGNEKGLISWWRFEEREGKITSDFKNQNNATLEGQVQWVVNPDPEASSLKLYVNGQYLEKVGGISNKTSWVNNVSQFTLGANKNDTTQNVFDQHFQGELEDIRIWQTVRTEEQIQDNLFRRVEGERDDLIAYYTFDVKTDDNQINDYSLRSNNLSLIGNAKLVYSTAPIGKDTPQVRSALAGIATPFSGGIESRPAVQEYGDMQVDSQGFLIGVFKRCYSFTSSNRWQIITAYKVGDMVTEWIGQAQFAPQLIGFIEGAPPVPSENLSMRSVAQIGDEDDYNEASVVELIEADETTTTYASSREAGIDAELSFKAGLKAEVEAQAGLGLEIETIKVEGSVGRQGRIENAWSWLEDASTSISLSDSKRTRLELRGHFGSDEGRFLPENGGLALVKSETADVYALRLKQTGALIAYQMMPNPDIPKDWNIIHFPINPLYTKQGTLDGKVGLSADNDYPNALTYGSDSSYFKPVEAYALKNHINREETQLKTFFDQYAVGAGDSLQFTLGRLLNRLPAYHKRNLVDTYVWTADGGLFVEAQETMDSKEEQIGGAFAIKGMLGVYGNLSAMVGGVGPHAEMEALLGGHLNLNIAKTWDSKESFKMDINLDKVERDLYAYVRNTDGKMELAGDPNNPQKVPGKVDAYRFMAFYLEPSSDHFDEFFNKVVDAEWLEQSDDPSAVALRGARDEGKKPPCWRVMYRVTYISRVLPPLDLSAPPSLEKTLQTLNIDSNYELIKQLEPYVRDHRSDFGIFSDKVNEALKTYLPELIPHAEEIKDFLSLYFGIDSGISPEPKLEGFGETEPAQIPNIKPIINVGKYEDVYKQSDTKITLTLNRATVTDDRLTNIDDLFLTWDFIPREDQQLDDVTFDASHNLTPKVTFKKKGVYTIRLTASDGILLNNAQTDITVNNQPVIESITADKPVRHGSGANLSWTVEMNCTIRTGFGKPSKDPALDVAWSIESGSKESVDLGKDEVSLQDLQDQDVLHITKTITIKTSGYYLIECVVKIPGHDDLSSNSQINLEIAARVTDDLQVLYTFEANEGNTVSDVSGLVAPLDLAISDSNHSWIDGGLQIQTPSMLTGGASRLVTALKERNEITLEAWVKSAAENLSGLRRILTLSNGPATRNFILAQSETAYHVGLRTTKDLVTDVNASLKSLVGGSVNTGEEMQHIVFTRDKDGKAFLYIDGEAIAERTISGDFSQWDDTFRLALGNELNSDGRLDWTWEGEYHLLAIYNRTLSPEEVKQNHDFGGDRDLPPKVFAGGDPKINWSLLGVAHEKIIEEQLYLGVKMQGRVTHDRPTLSGNIEWSQISGPKVKFQNIHDPTTEVDFPQSGRYQFRLTAIDDAEQVVSQEVTITVFHEIPVIVGINIIDERKIVTANNKITVNFSGQEASLTLNGLVKNSDGDDYPSGKCNITWECNSDAVTFDNNNKIDPTVTFHKNGIYEIILTAKNTDEEGKTASASVNITVNRPPIVDAGPDQNLFLSVGDSFVTTQLDGTVSDDGLPEPPGVLTLHWSVLDGHKDKVTIMSDENDFTEVQFKREGDYTLKLEADDGAVKESDTVKITVKNTGMLPDGGRKAKVVASGLHVRQEHDKDNKKNILYFLKKGDEVTLIDLWTNPETKAVWGRLRPTEKHDQDPQWSAMKEGDDTFLQFI